MDVLIHFITYRYTIIIIISVHWIQNCSRWYSVILSHFYLAHISVSVSQYPIFLQINNLLINIDLFVFINLLFQDQNGTIENEELKGFLKDLLELVKKV